jgi:hypothetical protein
MAAFKWINSVMPGVRYREHETRKHGKKSDRYFSIRYCIAKYKQTEQGVGWSSEGWTEKKAYDMLCRFKENAKTGNGPTTIAEIHEMVEAQKPSGITFSEFVDSYYIPHSKSSKKAVTVRTENISINKWFRPAFGETLISEIGFIEIDKLRQEMVESALSPRTIQYSIAMLRQIFNHAIDSEFPARLRDSA